MGGWKTWASGLSAFCTGLVALIAGAVSDPIDPVKIWAGILACAGALGVVGVGHKVEKNAK